VGVRYYAWLAEGGALRGRLGKADRDRAARAGRRTGEHGEGLGPYGYLAL